MNMQYPNKNELLNSLPAEWPEDLRPAIREQVKASRRKIVVLDDDPTGTQTVHGIPVLTEWPAAALRAELANDLPAFYILTNSRSMPLEQAQALNAEIGQNLLEAAGTAHSFAVVSRSDSTLRGHFPGEMEALAGTLGQTTDGWLIIPFFLEGGRYTINDIHYVAEGDQLVPAGETEFARDSAFGYRASNLREWVAEKTGGRMPAESVASVSIEGIRQGGPARVAEKLARLRNGAACIINAASMRDLEVFVRGLLQAEASGKRFLYRTAASFVQVRAGLDPRPILTQADLALPEAGGGLVVVGSYVPRSTGQVNALLAQSELIRSVEIQVEALLEDKGWQAEIERVAGQASQALQQDQNVMLYTSRKLITVADAAASLAIGRRVSDGLIATMKLISTRPRYLLAKGGITSSDVATQGLGIKRAMVLGQILPGVPVWQAGRESRYPSLTYIVFPGNVGGPEAMVEVVKKLEQGSKS
jgi:uncharacterized protein YgbK (DUF1537 family)